MKYRSEHYAQALLALSRGTTRSRQTQLIHRFVEVVAKYGDEKNLPKILHAVRRAVLKERGGRWITFEFARALPQTKISKIIHGLTKKTDQHEIHITPDIIAGVRVTIDDEQMFDGSLEQRLKLMFPSGRALRH